MSNLDRIKLRLRRDRPMVSVTLRMPKDVLDDLKYVAPELGFSGYQPLMRAYVGRGLREDLERLEDPASEALLSSLKRRGIDDAVLAAVKAEISKRK